jgi:hypothetical protein
MRAGIPRIYKSFEDFEREELRKLDSLGGSVDDMLDDMFAEELDFDEKAAKGKKKREWDVD